MKISYTSNRFMETQMQVADRMSRVILHMKEYCEKNKIKFMQIHDELQYEPLPEQMHDLIKELEIVHRREFNAN